jgi:ABC-2 type transport system permease protein
MHGPFLAFGLALIFSTVSIVSMGFLIASLVPTARFAQPIGTLFLYPMLGVAGLFVPVAALPPGLQVVSRFVPLTYVVSLLRGIWREEGWIRHAGDVAALTLVFVVCTILSARVFRWE